MESEDKILQKYNKNIISKTYKKMINNNKIHIVIECEYIFNHLNLACVKIIFKKFNLIRVMEQPDFRGDVYISLLKLNDFPFNLFTYEIYEENFYHKRFIKKKEEPLKINKKHCFYNTKLKLKFGISIIDKNQLSIILFRNCYHEEYDFTNNEFMKSKPHIIDLISTKIN